MIHTYGITAWPISKERSQSVSYLSTSWPFLDSDEAHPIRCIVGTEDDEGIVRCCEPPQVDSRLVPLRQI